MWTFVHNFAESGKNRSAPENPRKTRTFGRSRRRLVPGAKKFAKPPRIRPFLGLLPTFGKVRESVQIFSTLGICGNPRKMWTFVHKFAESRKNRSAPGNPRKSGTFGQSCANWFRTRKSSASARESDHFWNFSRSWENWNKVSRFSQLWEFANSDK